MDTTPSQVQAVLAEMAVEVAEFKRTLDGSITEMMAGWLTPQYLVAAREQLAAVPNEVERWKLLRLMASDLTELRRCDLNAERLELERERLALERTCAERVKEAEFWKWTKQPDIKRKLWPPKRQGISKKTLRKIETELRLM
jgi:hypothetical protein